VGPLFAVVGLVLLLLQLVLVARAILDWSVVLAGPSVPGSPRSKAISVVYRITEPILAPVRRVIPPIRAGGVGIDLSYIVVFLAIVVLRALLP
jgi:YggT family protein